MLGFQPGDVVTAYLKGKGFVGIARVKDRANAKPVREIMIDGRPLLSCALECTGMGERQESDEYSEYVALVEWIQSFDRADAFKRRSNLYATTWVRAELDG
jgi:uncharacterized protein